MPNPSSIITPDPADTVDCFLAALGRQDFESLEACLAQNVWFRALLPKSLHESNTAKEAVEAYRSWYGSARRFKVQTLEHSAAAGREHLRYRFLVLPPWAPEEWHLIEQSGFCRVKEGRISRLDIVCTGFHSDRGRPEATLDQPGSPGA